MYEAGVQSNPEPTQPARPRKATLLSILLMAFGGLGFLFAILLMSLVTDSHGASVPAYMYILVFVQFALSGAQVVSGVFVWQGRNWARVLAIALCSLNIVGAVASLFTGAILQAISGIAINAGLIRLLNDYEVQAWCDK